MKIVFGLFLLCISAIATLFFRHYTGVAIAHPVLWYVFFIVTGFFGVWLIYSAGKKVTQEAGRHLNETIANLKSNAEKIVLDFDKCEFKSGSFSHQVEDANMAAVKILAPAVLAPGVDTTISENVVQSYLTYADTIEGTPVKFISQSFPFDPTALKYHVLQNNITLYIDRFDRSKYLFELIK